MDWEEALATHYIAYVLPSIFYRLQRLQSHPSD